MAGTEDYQVAAVGSDGSVLWFTPEACRMPPAKWTLQRLDLPAHVSCG